MLLYRTLGPTLPDGAASAALLWGASHRCAMGFPDGVRRASVQAGAGVVADSVPDDEELETRNKAKALLAAVPAAELMTAQRRGAR